MLKLVVFDFDGVIAQSFEMCLGLNRMLEPHLTAEEYRTKFEGNINKAKARSGPMRVIDFFGEYEKHLDELEVTPGMPEVIKEISEKYDTAISSSTINHPIELFLDHHHLLQYFDAIYGNDVDKSKVVKFRMFMDKFQVTAAESLFITDTLGDIREANIVEVKTIGVTWGYHDRDRLSRGNPLAAVDQPKDILTEIEKLIASSK